jgi:hypothetical protein
VKGNAVVARMIGKLGAAEEAADDKVAVGKLDEEGGVVERGRLHSLAAAV